MLHETNSQHWEAQWKEEYPEWCFEWASVHPPSCTPTCRGNLWAWRVQTASPLCEKHQSDEHWEVKAYFTLNAQALPFCDTSRLFIWFRSFFINLSFWSRSSSMSCKKSRIGYCLSSRLRRPLTRCWSAHTIFSAVSREISCLSLIFASLSISCCRFKWSFSSSSSSIWPRSSPFSSSSSSAFPSKCLRRDTNQGVS